MQAPSPRQIVARGIDEYANAVMRANNTGNAWAVKEHTLTADEGIRRYDLSDVPAFGKALLITYLPQSSGPGDPEIPLEFTQIEQLPREWGWLADTGEYSFWGLLGWRRRRQYAAVFRTLETDGFRSNIEIRPTPKGGDQFRILYQVGQWEPAVRERLQDDVNFDFPFPELDFYFTSLVAHAMLPYTKWTAAEAMNAVKRSELKTALQEDMFRYETTFSDWVRSLSVTDQVFAVNYLEL